MHSLFCIAPGQSSGPLTDWDVNRGDLSMKSHGLPQWELDELPAPPPLSGRNLFRVIGPGAILLAASIGSGEWLLGPAAVLKSGTSLLTIVTISVLFQIVINTEAMRYTMYTGEPIFTGFMRTPPGALFWGNAY